MSFFVDPFTQYEFMRRALVACLCVSASAGPLGIILTHRRLSLIGDTMSHAVLPGVAIGFIVAGYSLVAMSIGGFVAGLVVAGLSGITSRATGQGEDTSLAGFYLISLALGVLIIAAKGSTLDLMHILFGSLLAVNSTALLLMAGIATLSLLTLAVIYRGLITECFDATFLKSMGGSGAVYHLTFLVLIVLNLIGSFMALGTLMGVGLLILPAAAARFLFSQVPQMMVAASGIAMLASVSGLLVSYHLGTPSGPSVVLVAGFIYIAAMLFGPASGVLTLKLKHRHLTR